MLPLSYAAPKCLYLLSINVKVGDSTMVVATPLRTSRHYSIFFVGWTKVIMTYLLPLSALVYFTFKIIRAVKFAASQADNQEEGESSL